MKGLEVIISLPARAFEVKAYHHAPPLKDPQRFSHVARQSAPDVCRRPSETQGTSVAHPIYSGYLSSYLNVTYLVDI